MEPSLNQSKIHAKKPMVKAASPFSKDYGLKTTADGKKDLDLKYVSQGAAVGITVINWTVWLLSDWDSLTGVV